MTDEKDTEITGEKYDQITYDQITVVGEIKPQQECPVHGKQRGGMRIVMTGDKTDYDKEFCMPCYIENVIEPNCHELKPVVW